MGYLGRISFFFDPKLIKIKQKYVKKSSYTHIIMTKRSFDDIDSIVNKMESLDLITMDLDIKHLDENPIEYINYRISKEFCTKTACHLSDSAISYELDKKEKEVRDKKIKKAKKNAIPADKENESEIKVEKLFTWKQEKALTKNVVTRLKNEIKLQRFQEISKAKLLELKLSTKRFTIKFNQSYNGEDIYDNPDWYIHDIETDKCLIGINRVNLWSSAKNRTDGKEFLASTKIKSEKTKLVAHVVDSLRLRTSDNFVFRLFDYGYHNDCICHPNGLEMLIKNYFDLH
jgi:hypothetical protein